MEILAQLGVDQTFWIQLVLFLTCYFFMSQFLFKPYLRNLEYRKKNTTSVVDEMQKLASVADTLAMEYEGKVKKQNEKALHLYTQLKQEGLAEEARVLNDAKKRAETVVGETNSKISKELEKTRNELQNMIPEMSKQAAAKILGRTFAIAFFILLAAPLVYGNENVVSHGHEGGIPKIVYFQALNFFGLLFLIGFLLRKKVRKFFSARHEELKSAVEESKRLKREVERRHEEYSVKLQSIDQQTHEVLSKIQKEGEQIRSKIIADAQKTAEQIESEAKKAVQVELEKAKKLLFDETLERSLAGAKSLLEKQIDDNDHKNFQNEFNKKIGSAH